MLYQLKPLVVVLVIALVAFAAMKPICVRYMTPAAFAQRRNVWLVLTVAAFVTPSFWVFLLVAAPVLYWSARNDPNPAAFYMVMASVVPPVSFYIPGIGINLLFEITPTRLLALVVLLPLAFRTMNDPRRGDRPRFGALDLLLLGYLGLQVVLLIPYESATNTARRTFLHFIDTFLVFYVFSRAVRSRAQLVEVMAGFCISAAVMAPLAVFETMKGWLLYQNINDVWGSPNVFAWLLRGGNLRAQVSTGHSIGLGFVMSVGLGFWLYLQKSLPSKTRQLMIAGWFTAGLLVSYSRGAWLAAFILFWAYVALRPNARGEIGRTIFMAFLVACVALASPLRDSVIDKLPIIGTSDQGSVDYRQQLAETSWMLVQRNPFFGDPFVMLQMEQLRQGQGIIDIVNAYAGVALFSGLVGLVLFAGLFVLATWKAFVCMRKVRLLDPDLSALGANLVACMLSSLFFIGTALVGTTQYVIVGLLASYIHIASRRTAPEAALAPSAYGSLPKGRSHAF